MSQEKKETGVEADGGGVYATSHNLSDLATWDSERLHFGV